MIHAIVSTAFKAPKIAVEKNEAGQLAGAIAKVMAHYGDIPGLNEKTLDWIGLFGTCAVIYGPRLMAARIEREHAAPKPQPKQKPPADGTLSPIQVTDIPGVGKVETVN